MKSRLLLVGPLLLGACVLFANPPDEGTHCQFAGDATECGACIVQHCGSAVDTCCLDTSCDDIIATTETCATQHDDTCDAIHARATSSDAAEASLAACITTACASSCTSFTGTSTTSCKDLAYGVSACSCTTAPPVTDDACSDSIYPSDRCCASPGWPGPALSCACLPLVCAPTMDGCLCNLSDYAAVGDAATCMGQNCCTADDYCACRVRPCDPGEKQVPSCSLAVVGCQAPDVRVDTCSIRVH